jgi:titin
VSIGEGASGNVIGGTAPGTGNVISGNNSGVMITDAGTTKNLVMGNRIGTDWTGTVELGNLFGVSLWEGAAGNAIGGTSAAARNIISGNIDFGVRIYGSSDNKVRGNFIGTDRTGTVELGNRLEGVMIFGGSTGNRIGGAVAGAGNVISGNHASGVRITDIATTGNIVRGNRIGLAVTGGAPLRNLGSGIAISAFGNIIGGEMTGAGNLIARNGAYGVDISFGTGNQVLGNSIFLNGGLGIRLANGLNPNDDGDADTGPNQFQNHPELTRARLSAAGLRIRGSINTEANKTMRIEFFASHNADPSGHGEGTRYLGAITVEMGVENLAEFSVLFPSSGVQLGDVITATATDEFGNTSEFSLARDVT